MERGKKRDAGKIYRYHASKNGESVGLSEGEKKKKKKK